MYFSVYFRLFPYPNNFWFFGFSLSLWSVQLEQFFFLTLEQFFFQYGLLQFLLESFQVEVLIRVVFNKNRSCESWKTSLAGNQTWVLPIRRWTLYHWADDPIVICLQKLVLYIPICQSKLVIVRGLVRQRTMVQSNQKCKEPILTFLIFAWYGLT